MTLLEQEEWRSTVAVSSLSHLRTLVIFSLQLLTISMQASSALVLPNGTNSFKNESNLEAKTRPSSLKSHVIRPSLHR